MDVLTRIGLVELALGAALGWGVAAQMISPRLVERVGVRAPRRILQTHLDFIVMGSDPGRDRTRAAGSVALAAAVIVAGTWLNPTLFVPLAFAPDVASRTWFQAVSALSFLLTSGGLVGAAVVGLLR